MKGWQNEQVRSLRESAHLLNPQNDFQSSCCNCKTGCTTQHCVCRKKEATCSSWGRVNAATIVSLMMRVTTIQTKRGKKYSKTELESESSDEGICNQPQQREGRRTTATLTHLRQVTKTPISHRQRKRGNTGKAVVILLDEESADEGK